MQTRLFATVALVTILWMSHLQATRAEPGQGHSLWRAQSWSPVSRSQWQPKSCGRSTRHCGPRGSPSEMTGLPTGLSSEVPSCSGIRDVLSLSALFLSEGGPGVPPLEGTPDDSRRPFVLLSTCSQSHGHFSEIKTIKTSYIHINSSLFQVTVFICSPIVEHVFPLYTLNFSSLIDL